MTVRPTHLSMPRSVPICGDVTAALHQMVADGHRTIALWGAGDHTRRIVGSLIDTPIEVACLADDDATRHGRRFLGWEVLSVDELLHARDVTAVLISSRHSPHVDRMWAEHDRFRAAGKTLYKLTPECETRPADLALPPLLAVTVPKSGTWLLMRLLTLMGYEAYRGQRAMARLVRDHNGPRLAGEQVFELLPANQATTLHEPTIVDLPAYERFVRTGNCKVVLLIRDPRDVVVSRAHFWKHPDNVRHATLRGLSVHDVMDRLIEGYGDSLPGINQLMLSYRLLFDAPHVHVIRFEQIVRAVQSPDDPEAIRPIRALMRHIGVGEFTADRLQAMLAMLEVKPAPGRQSVTNEWLDEFGDRQRELFARHASRCLEVFGYDAMPRPEPRP